MADDNESSNEPRAPALEELFRSIAPSLVAWASIRIPEHLRSQVTPEDLAQEVWLRAVRIYATSFDPARSSARSWLFGLAKNILLEAQRAALRHRERPAEGRTSKLMALEQVPESITSFTARIGRDEGVRQFLVYVDGMSEDDRKLLLYCGMEDLPLREAAERLGVDLEVASKRWQRLRTRLAELRVSRDLLAV